MGPDELFQRAVIARRYYLEGRTRIQIAEEFGISRFKVARELDEALSSGMVEITIHNPGSTDLELSTELQHRFNLEHAYVVTDRRPHPDQRVDAVAKATAELLQSILREEDVVGVDCGRTLTKVANHLTSLPRSDVVQLTGMAGTLTSNGADLVRRLTEISGGRSWPLYAPLVVADARTAASLSSDHQIQETVARHAKVTCAIVSDRRMDARRVPGVRVPDHRRSRRAGACGRVRGNLRAAARRRRSADAWAGRAPDRRRRGDAAGHPDGDRACPPGPRRSPRHGRCCAQDSFRPSSPTPRSRPRSWPESRLVRKCPNPQ